MNRAHNSHPVLPSGHSDVSSPPKNVADARDTTEVFLVDDHPAIREALSSAIERENGMRVVGDSASADDALPNVETLTPDVIVIDISLGGQDGLPLVHLLRARVPDARILIFSMYDENVYAERALRAGASGYVMKSEPIQKMVEAIDEVSEGQVYLSPSITSHILSNVVRTGSGSATSQLDILSDRELTVFRMVGEGRGIHKISSQLSLNRKTVEAHRRQAKEKLGYETVDELLQFAVKWTSSQG